PILRRLRLFLKAGSIDSAHAPDGGEGYRRDAGARHELHLGGGAEAFDLVAGFAQAIGEGHRVAGRMGRSKKLLRAGATVVALRASCPCDRKLVERAARHLDPTLTSRQ